MILPYKYELWDGRKVVGYYYSMCSIRGKFVSVSEVSELKRGYGHRYDTIDVPVITRIVSQTATDTTFRVVLDVRKKSRRQIDILKSGCQE